MAVPPSLRVPWLLQCRPAPPFSGVCWAECAVAVGTLVSRLQSRTGSTATQVNHLRGRGGQ